MKRKLTFLGILFFLIAVGAAANTAPTITAAAPINLTQGDPATSAIIATVNDAEDGAGSLSVVATSVPSGITIDSISNNNGSIGAYITAACDASSSNNIVLEVTDSGGLTATATFQVFVQSTLPPPIPTITAATNGTGTSDQACPEQPLVLTAHSFEATSYQWYQDGGAIDGATSQTYSATSAGTYTVTAANACYTTAQSFMPYVVQNPTPHKANLSVLSGSASFCEGDPFPTLWSDSATGIQWYSNGFPISGANNQYLVATESGSYTVILNALGCHSQESDPVIVTRTPAPSAPTITAAANGTGTSDQACPEQPLLLVAHDSNSSLTNYQWYHDNDAIDGATSNQYSATGSGDYSIVATLNGCSARSNVYTVQNPTPHKATISVLSESTTICTNPGGWGVQLQSDSATGIQWYNNGFPISGANNQNLLATESGSYTVILNALGCHSEESDPIVVTVNTAPETPAITATQNSTGTSDQACPEVPLVLTANDSNPSSTSYQWYVNNETIDGATSKTYSATRSGDFTVTATSPEGCSMTSAAYTVQNPTPHTPFLSARSATTFCTGGSVIIDSDSATGIQWYKDGVAISGATHQSYTATTSGSYNAQLNALGCHSQFGTAIVVTVADYPSTPTVTGTSDQACPEQPLTLTASSTGATSYQWYRDDELLSGETGPTLTVTAASSYSASATNGTCTTPRSSGYAVQNPTPHAPFLSARSATTFCTGGSVIIDSDSATGIQWYKDGVAISGATHQSYTATTSGSYNAQLNALGCHSQFGTAIVVTVVDYPSTPTVTGTSDQACPEQPLTLTASSTGATSFQWYRDDELLSGETGPTLTVTAASSYSATATNGTCTTPRSASYVVQNPTPHKATLSVLSGSATFCEGGSVTLWSDSATGIQWYRNGVAISGATQESYVASVSGSYTVILNALGCHSSESDPIVVTVNANPNATITAPSLVISGSTGNSASVASAGTGATYNWSISGGTITAGSGTNAITFTAGSAGTLTLSVTVTTSAGCSDTKTASVSVINAVTVTSVKATSGSSAGGTSVTIKGTNFESGATVTFGGVAATNVVVNSSTKIFCTTPAHAQGTVDVVVTNTNTASGTLSGGFTYKKN